MSDFFVDDTATTGISTLSLHDALPICGLGLALRVGHTSGYGRGLLGQQRNRSECRRDQDRDHPTELSHSSSSCEPAKPEDRKSTRLNSSHGYISYAVFCLKKKKDTIIH